MHLSCKGYLSSSCGALYEAYLEKVWFYDVFDCVLFFSYHGSQSVESDRFAAKSTRKAFQDLSVKRIKSSIIHSKILKYLLESTLGLSVMSNCHVIPEYLDESIDDSRCSSAFLGYHLTYLIIFDVTT